MFTSLLSAIKHPSEVCNRKTINIFCLVMYLHKGHQNVHNIHTYQNSVGLTFHRTSVGTISDRDRGNQNRLS